MLHNMKLHDITFYFTKYPDLTQHTRGWRRKRGRRDITPREIGKW